MSKTVGDIIKHSFWLPQMIQYYRDGRRCWQGILLRWERTICIFWFLYAVADPGGGGGRGGGGENVHPTLQK